MGFVHSPVTGYWVHVKCGKPTEAWWREQVKEVEKLLAKGRCTRLAGLMTDSKPPKCAGFANG